MNKIDPVCLIHGKKWSEHKLGFCLYCCLCFKPLTPEECNVRADGKKEDVCKPCAAKERKITAEVKSLAQHLDKYIEQKLIDSNDNSWCEFFKQALTAYENTQGVRIGIKRV